jgi:hypothetical protein
MKSSTYHGVTLSPVQMANMAKRLDDLSTKSEMLLCKLELDEVKQRLPALAKELEGKMKTWNSGRFGSQAEVRALHKDYQVRNFDELITVQKKIRFIIFALSSESTVKYHSIQLNLRMRSCLTHDPLNELGSTTRSDVSM